MLPSLNVVLAHSVTRTSPHTCTQVWWVMRSKFEFIVQRKFPFNIVGPPCDWDVLNNRSHIYAANTTSYNFEQNPYQARGLCDLGAWGRRGKGEGWV